MSQKAIDTKYYLANYRASASYGNNVLGQLDEAHPVDVLGPRTGGRWLPCSAEGISGTIYISDRVLRDRLSATRENLVRQSVNEWNRFDRETGRETNSPYNGFVGQYWASIGMSYTGNDDHIPWSAAFISFCVKTAGGYSAFKFAAAHSKYVNQAINQRQKNIAAGFWGFRLNEHKPQVGDIICRSRAGQNATYDFAATHSSYKSHCDIVISVRDNHVSTLGGNVSNTVKRSNYPINSSGYCTGGNGAYAVLRNNQ